MSHRSLNYYAPSYLRMAKTFRNGVAISWSHYWHREPNDAVFWNGCRFRMPPGRGGLADTVVEMWGREVYTSGGFYEPKANDIILDIGANVGAFSLWLAQRSPKARVFAVEPSAENLAELTRNISGWPHTVSVVPLAVSGQPGSGVMVDGGRRSVDHRVERSSPESSGTGSVEFITLDQLLDKTGAGDVHLLKMDIEGAEFDVFSEITPPTLERLSRISLEYHDNLRPGALALIIQRLSGTHKIVAIDHSAEGYGILRAVRR